MPDERYKGFLHIQNIKAYEERLTTETDPAKRAVLVQLLAEERAGKGSPPRP